ncbi:oxidoreductase NAD-binding domain-containing protein 1-like isoform X2 [Tubulanus polymorphus]
MMNSRTNGAGGKTHLEITANDQRGNILSAATVEKIENISPKIKRMILKVEDQRLTFKPGQWVDFYVPGMKECTGFSMVSTPKTMAENGILELAVKQSIHPITNWVHSDCGAGSQVNIRVGGDYFYSPVSDADLSRDILFLAGGVGVNPLYCMWQNLADLYSERIGLGASGNNPTLGSVHLMFSAPSVKELIFKDEILKTCEKLPQFSHKFFVTGNLEDDLKTADCEISNRRIQSEDIRSVLENVADKQNLLCFICGPSAMTNSIADLLKHQHIQPDNIRFEKWF